MRLLNRKLAFAFAAFSASATLHAHNAPGSVLLLDFRSSHIDAELRLPLSELELAYREPLEATPDSVLARHEARLVEYIRQHVSARAPDRRAWTLEITHLDVVLAESPVDFVAKLQLQPPPGAPLRRFTLRSDAIAHEVINHVTFVSVRRDWNHALLGEQPELLGSLHSFAPELEIDRSAGHPWSGFRRVVVLGAHHIADGTDHVLFLLVLLLPAPLRAAGKRWAGFGSTRSGLMTLAKIVTAFTIGHSLTLLAGSLGWLRLPAQPVEVVIALSIFVSAVHAVRPWFAGREAWVAAGFGLVHGLAFAGILGELQLDAWQLAFALLGFNLGIELVQLLIVLATMPWLLLLSRTGAYAPLRLAGAGLAGIAALTWAAERALGWPNPVNAFIERLAENALWLLISLAVFAMLLARRRRMPAAIDSFQAR